MHVPPVFCQIHSLIDLSDCWHHAYDRQMLKRRACTEKALNDTNVNAKMVQNRDETQKAKTHVMWRRCTHIFVVKVFGLVIARERFLIAGDKETQINVGATSLSRTPSRGPMKTEIESSV